MKPYAKLIAGVVIVAALVTVALYLSRPAQKFEGEGMVGEAVTVNEQQAGTTSLDGVESRVGESVEMSADPLSVMTFEKIKADAERGSAIAQRQISEIYGMCMAYSLSPATQLATLDHLASLNPDSKESLEMVKKRLVARCDQVDPGQPIPMEAMELWAQQAANNGDVAAKIRLRTMSMDPLTGEEASQRIDAVVEARDPQAMLEMSNLMSRQIADEMPDRYAKVAGNALAGAAWGIVACRAGAACGNGSIVMDSICMSTGKCNYRSYDDFLMSELVPPAEQKRVNSMIDHISQLNKH